LGANVENLTLGGSAAINATGNALDNVLTGNSGNNVLDGGAGNDTMSGGAGDDTYVVDSVSDVVSEGAGGGTDTVQTALAYTLGSNMENLTLTGSGHVNGYGNELGNVLTGNAGNNTLAGQAGDDTLLGGGGNDLLIGGEGADAMAGGTGNDTYGVDNAGDTVTEASGEGTDTVVSLLSFALGANVENLTLGGSAAINAAGNALDNVLTGNSGANTLTGGDGVDTLIGGAGNDTFVFDATLNAATNVDVISDFSAGDTILLDNDVFASLGAPGALNASQFHAGAGLTGSTSVSEGAGIYYDTSNGSLYYDADGFGGQAGVQFAVVSGHPALTGAAFAVQD
ncbi:MAG: calcium-binding protein, partial [Burkholderiales bacterium]